MSRTRLAAAVVLTTVFAVPAVLHAPAPRPEHQPLRVRPGHARVQVPAERPASVEAPVPVRLTALETPDDPDSTEALTTADVAVDVAAPAMRSLGGGLASYYGAELAGNATASGERFDPSDLTAAHRTLPFGTRVAVTNPRTGASVTVRINDRGPFHRSRVIDLSHEAARQIGIARAGTGRVELAVVEG